MSLDLASRRQVEAADPASSVWLSANAGSGKTRVLIDRVARLLLDGTEPQRILCLTYTKAAATEMQNRLFARLGDWAMLPDNGLRRALAELGVGADSGRDTLRKARRLFAQAIDTPGGLKIQTIHSFCAGLLRRFPLEAQVSPDFVELDDRSRRDLLDAILNEIADGPAATVLTEAARLSSGTDLGEIVDEICQNSDAFSRNLTLADCINLFGLPENFDERDVIASVFIGGEAELFAAMVPLLQGGGATDAKLAETLAAVDASRPSMRDVLALEVRLLTGAKATSGAFAAKIGSLPNKPMRDGPCAPFMPAFEALMLRVEASRPLRIALAAARRGATLHALASAFLPRFRAEKARHGWLDFDDLIRRSAALLSDRDVAAWVLYRLDGGIDHILVDEAQDTSPAQWQVIESLAEEFTAGQGVRDVERTIFVVGDKKQSIYSFQGADLEAFDRMRAHFAQKYRAANMAFQPLELEHSFRSSEAILRVVDLTFDERVQRGVGGAMRHIAFHDRMPGRVDLWPLVPKTVKPEHEDWTDPKDLLSEDHHIVLLARRIAGEIRRMIDSGTRIETKDGSRPVHEGDFLILVQRRSEMFHQIIRACKDARLEIAGADRLRLGGELAVRDLTALLEFVALPEDDLSLAAALRSPIFGLSEGGLYSLATSRGDEKYLWKALFAREAEFADTVKILRDLRDRADFLRPYEMIERMLTRHQGRQKLIGRLGPEAEDGIDVLLAQALAYEQSNVPSLTGFLAWMAPNDVDVKRRPDSARRAIRVMTVHGAKGLEAPIVILPDTLFQKKDTDAQVLTTGEGALWKTPADESPELIGTLRDDLLRRQREERMRLLYVAMTRAERWLILCGAGEAPKDGESWYQLAEDGLRKAGAAEVIAPGFDGAAILRHETGHWPDPAGPVARVQEQAAEVLPDWVRANPPPRPEAERPLSPSQLGGAKALAGAEGDDPERAMLRGTVLHRLLELLPHWQGDERGELIAAILDETRGLAEAALSGDEVAELAAMAGRVLTGSGIPEMTDPSALLEVEVTGPVAELGGRTLHGTIDRLIVGPDRVLAIDYKSNATVPATPDAVPEGILRQMGAYAALLGQIYPDRRIETAILWTATGQLMPLPPEMVRHALAATPIP
ncbi:MAG TPA: double-strand break repair helicase AddA [Albidovulum sp.]|uniref:double-strand break repair helicase AddA n=1 Tax=Albidovulum sp. TaxID=1872424 RepID=UPI002CB83E18|nr:double-strand break repair helicase AddA [Albidovulum sp.]